MRANMQISLETRRFLAPITLSSLFFSSALRELPAQNISADGHNQAIPIVKVERDAKHLSNADSLTRAKQTYFEDALQGLREKVEVRLNAFQDLTKGQVLDVPLVNLTTNFGKSLEALSATLRE